jgi:hypothetical protein
VSPNGISAPGTKGRGSGRRALVGDPVLLLLGPGQRGLQRRALGTTSRAVPVAGSTLSRMRLAVG